MVLGTICFFCGFVMAAFIVSILSINHNTPNDHAQLLELALNDERKTHQAEYDRVRKYHLIVVGERDAVINKLRQRNAELELKLVQATGLTAAGVEVEVAHV